MTAILDISNPWRDLLRTPASWRGIIFFVETGTRLSGRRTVVHEFPKRNDPYSEDMGRTARRISFSGYLIYRINPGPGMAPYVVQRERLMRALEDDGPGTLIHPVFWPDGASCMCERYSMSETRLKGGYTEFEMQFVELGTPGNVNAAVNLAGVVQDNATAVDNAASQTLNNAAATSGGGGGGGTITIGTPVVTGGG